MILFITRKYPPSIGGMQELSYRLTTEMGRLVESSIISWGGGQQWLPVFVISAFVRALIAMARADVTLIHLGDPVLTPLGVILRAVGRVPVVVTAHGLDIAYPHRLYQIIVPASLRRLDRVICISTYTKEECVKRGVPAERCVVIPPGIDVEGYSTILSDDDRRCWANSWRMSLVGRHVLLTVGRLVPRKGVCPFVREALPLLLARRQDWVYLIAGDGPERCAIETAVESYGLSGYVKVLGELDHAALRAAYALADLFVMPNIHIPGNPEGFGLVVLQARASGKPVVAADLEGICDAIGDGEDGTLVNPGEWSEFVEAIGTWLGSVEAETQRQHRRRRVEYQYSWSRIADEYLAVFRDAEGAYQMQRRDTVVDSD